MPCNFNYNPNLVLNECFMSAKRIVETPTFVTVSSLVFLKIFTFMKANTPIAMFDITSNFIYHNTVNDL